MRLEITRTVGTVLRVFVGGFLLMLAFDALNDDVSSRVPAIGYWPSVWLMFLSLALVSTFVGEGTSDALRVIDLEEDLR